VFDGMRCVLCGGCVDVCPTICLKIVSLDAIEAAGDINVAIDRTLGTDADRGQNAAILKDEDRCIRCALCAMRCPVDAITMERVQFTMKWSDA
jgi:formate dehydrogenase (NADP+) beta subunit